MLTASERLDKLEADVVELKAALQIAGAVSVFVLQAALDQMVDERILPAATRTEIFGRLRRELAGVSVGSREIARGATHAIPFYRTKAEGEDLKQREARYRKEDERVRKELLQLREKSDPTDQ